ncbi:hypothetical protein DFJ74DRAFT_707110 [Hyaloraphidium curvatum]|nr:hypothetical protein DFJ74DRAFT_707110 [Hyaloraphidium curvatum]
MFKLFGGSPSRSPSRGSPSPAPSPSLPVAPATSASMDGPEYKWVAAVPLDRFASHGYRSIATVQSDNEPREYGVWIVWPRGGEGAVFAVQQSCPHAGIPMDYGDVEEVAGDWQVRCSGHNYDFSLQTGRCKKHPQYCARTWKVRITTAEEEREMAGGEGADGEAPPGEYKPMVRLWIHGSARVLKVVRAGW